MHALTRQIHAGLYGMADAHFGDPVLLTAVLLENGCRTIQLRCKGWAESRLLEAAIAALALTRRAGAHLIINDSIECARSCGADGVHLGQGDGSIHDARATLGPSRIVGRSTHTTAEVEAATREGADYIGFGPIYPTQTKDTGFQPQGIQRLSRATAAFEGPVVAIGGIQLHHIPDLRSAGAHAWAIGSGVWSHADPAMVIAASCDAGSTIEER